MEYILDFKPKIVNIDNEFMKTIENKLLNNLELTVYEVNLFLINICFITRYNINSKMNDYNFKCDLAQSIIYHYLKYLNVDIKLCATHKIIETVKGHSFIVIRLNIEEMGLVCFLIDPTYIQFFTKSKCNSNMFLKLENKIHFTPDPGFFIEKKDYPIIEQLNNNGFILLTDKVASIYGNSFYMTKVGDYVDNYIPYLISGKTYINAFLKGNEQPSYSEEQLNGLKISLFNKKFENNSKSMV